MRGLRDLRELKASSDGTAGQTSTRPKPYVWPRRLGYVKSQRAMHTEGGEEKAFVQLEAEASTLDRT